MKEALRFYRPSNSDDGLWFEGKFCNQCYRNRVNVESRNQCIHLIRALCGETNDRWVYQDGKPVCTAFRSKSEMRRIKRMKQNNNQMKLFCDSVLV